MTDYAEKHKLKIEVHEIPWKINNNYQKIEGRLLNGNERCAYIDAITNRGILLKPEEIYEAAFNSEYILGGLNIRNMHAHLLYNICSSQIIERQKKRFKDIKSVKIEALARDRKEDIDKMKDTVIGILYTEDQTEPIEILIKDLEGHRFLKSLLKDAKIYKHIIQKKYNESKWNGGPFETRWYNFDKIFFFTDDDTRKYH